MLKIKLVLTFISNDLEIRINEDFCYYYSELMKY